MFLLSKSYWDIQQTPHKGNGVFAKKPIAPGIVLGDYIGTILRTKDVDLEKDQKGLYLMYYHDQASLFPHLDTPGIHLLNHSCTPNSWLYTYKGHTLAFTLRQVFTGEELTISYLLSPQDEFCHPCTHICTCESIVCSKSMHLSVQKYTQWRKFQNTRLKKDKREKIRYGTQLPLLSAYPKSIPDNPIYDLFGATGEPASQNTDTIMPSVIKIRALIRKTGKVLYYPALKTLIYGIKDNQVISIYEGI